MGLDTSHDAFRGAYSAFNRFRQEIARAIGGSFPPHYVWGEDGSIKEDENGRLIRDTTLEERAWYFGDDYSEETHPGLFEFMRHSDCDGEISPEMCSVVADELERLIPSVEALGSQSHGHIAARGGYVEVLKKFIAGCRAAAEEGAPLDFH